MRNIELWKETKFINRRGHWRPNPDRRALTPGSRLIAALVAEKYEHYFPRYARGHFADLGCGKVPFWGMYRQFTTHVTCADWPFSLHQNLHIDVACDLTRPLPFRDAVFDTVLLSDVLEHIPEPKECLREIARTLRPGGVLLMNTPFFYWLHEMPHDYYRYTEFALRYLLEQAGYVVEVLEPVGGSPEVVADLAAKHLAKLPLVGSAVAGALASLALTLRRLRAWRSFSAKSARLLPLGYFVVARRAS